MSIVAISLFVAASIPLAAAAYGQGFNGAAIALILLLGVSIPVVLTRRQGQAHALFLAYGGLIGFLTLSGLPPLLCVASMSAALYGWDTALANRLLARPTIAGRRHTLWYAGRNLLLTAAGLPLIVLARSSSLRLTFGTGLALALSSLLLAFLLLRSVRNIIAADRDT